MSKNRLNQEGYFTGLREEMVERQLIRRGIKDARVVEAFRKVPRHKFVPPSEINQSYADYPLSIGCSQTISQPYIVGLMTQSLKLKPSDTVLEVGTGSGYQTAILAEIAAEVYSIERIAVLAQRAKNLLEGLGYRNVEIKLDNGIFGWPQKGPFDAVIVTAATAHLPGGLLEQLSDSGRMVIPLGGRFSQTLTRIEKQKQGGYITTEICGCVFVPLIDKAAR